MTSPGEIAALGAVLGAAILLARSALGARGTALATCASVVIITFVSGTPEGTVQTAQVTPERTPGKTTTIDYVSSAACRGCHPAEHASFGRTFHRTMTQRATPAAVRAPLDGRPLDLDGRTIRFERRANEVWATLPDPDAVIAGEPAADVTRRVVLTTGSHREQAFWVPGRRSGDLRLVPFVWLIDEAAFVPRRDAFLQPPNAPMPPVRWASSCIACHAVAGEPRHDPSSDSFDTRTAELGIACEACHGPGRAHVERHRDPIERYLQHASTTPDPTIVHPRKLPPERSAAVCGQCHAYAFPRDESSWWTEGYSRTFRAGDMLDPSRTVLDPKTLARHDAPVVDAPVTALFWPDGSVRVGGREYAGLIVSPCYVRGEGDRKMTCLSCHAMHAGDPSGQIAPDRAGDRACTSCHVPTPHSHHAPEAASCVSCHMPKTSYALLRGVRSHRIESPAASLTKPNACNLCHLDKSLAWTARWLTTWYGAAEARIPEARANVAAGIYDGLAGDAAVRALIADALATSPWQERDALLDAMRDDPYAAVRFIAMRSNGKAVPHSKLDPTLRRSLEALRDDRPVMIAE